MSNKYLQQFEKKFSTTRLITRMCGADVLRQDYRMTWITWSVIALINVAIILSFYNIYMAIYVYHDFVEVLKCLCMFGTAVQGYVKLINGIVQKEYYRFFYNEIIDLYSTYAKMDFIYQKYLGKSISLVRKLINILWSIPITVSIVLIGVPILYKYIYNERLFIMPIYLPVIDRNTDFGFYLTFVFHVVCVIFGCFGNMLSDCWCFVFAAHIPLIKNILKCKFNRLDELLEISPNEVHKSKHLLLDIFKWHQKYIIYCSNVKNLFFWVIFVQVGTTFLGIVCTTVCIFLNVWPAAPIYLIYSFVILYFFCALGNTVENSNDDVMAIIYDSNWYQLTVMEQKMIIIMLREAQQAEGMSIGGVAPLTLNTALQLTKTLYTFSMMLRNFLD